MGILYFSRYLFYFFQTKIIIFVFNFKHKMLYRIKEEKLEMDTIIRDWIKYF